MSSAFKVLLVGDGGVGKTAFRKRVTEGEFEKRYIATMGVEVTPTTFASVYPDPEAFIESKDSGTEIKMDIEDMININMNIWDTAGQEKFSGLRDGYYLGAHGAIVMFDLTSRISYRNVATWITKIRRMCDNIPIVIVGNKSDCQNQQTFDPMSPTHEYIRISVKTGENVGHVFRKLINDMIAGEE